MIQANLSMKQKKTHREQTYGWKWGGVEEGRSGSLGLANASYYIQDGFPGDPGGKEYACSAGDQGSIPRSGRSPGEGNGNPLQYSCLESSMDRGAWRATVHEVTKSWTRLSD